MTADRVTRLQWAREFYAIAQRAPTAATSAHAHALSWTHLFYWAGWE